jgi:type II secretory pathway component PulJ
MLVKTLVVAVALSAPVATATAQSYQQQFQQQELQRQLQQMQQQQETNQMIWQNDIKVQQQWRDLEAQQRNFRINNCGLHPLNPACRW